MAFQKDSLEIYYVFALGLRLRKYTIATATTKAPAIAPPMMAVVGRMLLPELEPTVNTRIAE